MPVGVDDRLGTKAAQTENQDDVFNGFHLIATTLGRPKSR
jgi:hypothetical protein